MLPAMRAIRGILFAGALGLGACVGTDAEIEITGAGREHGPPVPIDLSTGGWIGSREDLTCDPIVDEAEIDAFLEEHRRSYVVIVGEGRSERGLVSIVDPSGDCVGECLTACADRWICATLQCGPGGERDGDPDTMYDEVEGSGYPVPGRREEPVPPAGEPRDDDGDDRFDPPDPGPMPGI